MCFDKIFVSENFKWVVLELCIWRAIQSLCSNIVMIKSLIYVFNPYMYPSENYISPRCTSELNLADFPKLDKVTPGELFKSITSKTSEVLRKLSQIFHFSSSEERAKGPVWALSSNY